MRGDSSVAGLGAFLRARDHDGRVAGLSIDEAIASQQSVKRIAPAHAAMDRSRLLARDQLARIVQPQAALLAERIERGGQRAGRQIDIDVDRRTGYCGPRWRARIRGGFLRPRRFGHTGGSNQQGDGNGVS